MKYRIITTILSLLCISLISCSDESHESFQKYENLSAEEWNRDDGISIDDSSSLLYEYYPDFLSEPRSSGRHIVVSPNGKNSNPGTLALPLKSITTALSIAEKGDIIFLREGIYSESIQLNCQGDKDAWITIMPYPNEKVVFDGENNFEYAFSLKEKSNYISICGLEIKNYNQFGVLINGTGSNIALKDLCIHDIGCSVLSASGFAGIMGEGKNILIKNCNIYDISRQRLSDIDHGIYLTQSENYLITGCSITNCPGGGIHIYCGGSPSPKSTNLYIQNNIIGDCKYGMVLASCDNVYISNNNINNVYNSYFFVLDYVANTIIQNNILMNEYKVGDIYYAGGWDNDRIKRYGISSAVLTCNNGEMIKGNTFSHNIIWQDMDMRFVLPPLYEDISTISKLDKSNKYDTTLIADPMLDDNCKPLKNSPCIDSGISNDYSPRFNYDGEIRTTMSIGAY